jgi:hypothetical protein
VRRPENAGGYEKLLWREAHQRLVAAEESGWRTAHPFVWGGALAGSREIVHGSPGENLTLTFTFYPGEPAYAKLVGNRAWLRLSRWIVGSAVSWVSSFATAGWLLDCRSLPTGGSSPILSSCGCTGLFAEYPLCELPEASAAFVAPLRRLLRLCGSGYWLVAGGHPRSAVGAFLYSLFRHR